MIAAGIEQYDDADDYVIDVFTGPRDLRPSRPYDHNIAANYARFASDINEMDAEGVAVSYNKELASAARCFPNPSDAAQQFIDMHKRHASAVSSVLIKQVALHAADFISGNMDRTSMLGMIGRGEHLADVSTTDIVAPVKKNGNVFRKAGDFWEISYGGRQVQLKHSKGLAHIAFLLQNPDREFESMHLVLNENGVLPEISKEYSSMSEEELDAQGLHISGFTGAGEIMDAEYLAEVKGKLKELQEHRDMAEVRGDSNAVREIDSEMSEYMRAVGAAIGLGGRHRTEANSAERARVSIRQAISRVLNKLVNEHPTLHEHLNSSLITGAKCSYVPSSTIHWNF